MTLALKHTIVAILLILSLAAQVAAGPLEDAIVAYNRRRLRGRHPAFSAIGQIQGSETAQFNVGTMYANGQGVPQNYVLAYKWFSLWVAAQGYTDAVKGRDFITARMTPAEVNESVEALSPGRQHGHSDFNAPRRWQNRCYRSHTNDAITLYFVVDSGAADVSIPANVVSRLALATRILLVRENQLADGSTTVLKTFRIRSLKVGDTVVEDVTGSVAPAQGTPLLGQSFLRHFGSWSIDNATHELLLKK